MAPFSLAAIMPLRMLGEFLLVLIPTARSPFCTKARTWREKTLSKAVSLPTEVRIEVSVVRAMAGRATQFTWTGLTISAATLGIRSTTAVAEENDLSPRLEGVDQKPGNVSNNGNVSFH